MIARQNSQSAVSSRLRGKSLGRGIAIAEHKEVYAPDRLAQHGVGRPLEGDSCVFATNRDEDNLRILWPNNAAVDFLIEAIARSLDQDDPLPE